MTATGRIWTALRAESEDPRLPAGVREWPRLAIADPRSARGAVVRGVVDRRMCHRRTETIDCGGRGARVRQHDGRCSAGCARKAGSVCGGAVHHALAVAGCEEMAPDPVAAEPPAALPDGGHFGVSDTVPDVTYQGETLNKRFGVTTLETGKRVGDKVSIEVSLRDHACEDGDIVSIQIRRASDWEELFNGEILRRWQDRIFEATVGYHYVIIAVAVNGTGYKVGIETRDGCGFLFDPPPLNTPSPGYSNFLDINSGEMRVVYGSSSETARWKAPGGSGSAGVINVTP